MFDVVFVYISKDPSMYAAVTLFAQQVISVGAGKLGALITLNPTAAILLCQ